MSIRTDLVIEAADTGDGRLPEGVATEVEDHNGVTYTRVRIETQSAALRIGRPPGTYITLDGELTLPDADTLSDLLDKTLTEMLPEGLILVCGLGNTHITPDALGPLAAGRVMATRHIDDALKTSIGLEGLRPVAVIAPGVLGQTGIETSEIVQSVVKSVAPKALLVIDALAARSLSRLGHTIQVCDTGIAPGAGVQNARKELSKSTLGIPVVSVGIPTVVDSATLVEDLTGGAPGEEAARLMVTPREIDSLIDQGASLIARGINRALQPELDDETIHFLMS
jgi:spore protease